MTENTLTACEIHGPAICCTECGPEEMGTPMELSSPAPEVLIAETHRMVSELHAFAVQAHAAITEMQSSGGGMMGMMMKMMSGKKG